MDTLLVGKTIAHLRKKAGYTQKDLASRIGISDKAVSKWERGAGLPDIGYLRKLAILLNTDAESLLAGNAALADNAWQGILILPDNREIGSDIFIYDKPLINYLLGYFLLLGVKRIIIAGTGDEILKISEKLGDGSKLGVELKYSKESFFDLVHDGSISSQNVMIVYDRTILYGVDQTRFFQRAMMHRNAFSLLSFPKHGNQLTHAIHVNAEKLIVKPNEEYKNDQYDYSYVPFLFCNTRLLSSVLPEDSVESFVLKLIETETGYAEDLDRGFVEIKVHDLNDVNEASNFVRIVQEKCGMEIYCLEEIAWRRGMISMGQLKQLASDTAYGQYIRSLCERYEKP